MALFQFPQDPRVVDSDGADSYAAVVAERDELLTVPCLGEMWKKCCTTWDGTS